MEINTCSDPDLPTPIDCGDGRTDCVIPGIAENAVITGITGVADTGRNGYLLAET